MTFFNATLILGTLAAVVPIALHLLARREPQRVVFPGVQFLRPKLSSQRSRLRIRRWWLLALRVLAVIALAVALARPHIDSAMSSTWWTVGLMGLTGVGFLILASVAVARGMGRSLAVGVAVAGLLALLGSLFLGTRTWATSGDLSEGNEQPVAMALLIDNGPSSKRLIASSDGTNSSRLENAIREAATVIERLPDGPFRDADWVCVRCRIGASAFVSDETAGQSIAGSRTHGRGDRVVAVQRFAGQAIGRGIGLERRVVEAFIANTCDATGRRCDIDVASRCGRRWER